MIHSVLFAHIAGVLAMFAGLTLEAFGVDAARKAAPRLSGLAAAVIVLSGFYLGRRFGVLGDDWMLASYTAIVGMTVAGAWGRRSIERLRLSLSLRTAFALAIVFLMTAKPGGLASLLVLGIALAGGALVGAQKTHGQPVGVSEA